MLRSIGICLLAMSLTTSLNAAPTGTRLHYLMRGPKVASAKPPLLLLLHGVGSNEADLFSFADQLPDEYLVVSARAPITLGPESYAWYQVDFSTGTPIFNAQQAE